MINQIKLFGIGLAVLGAFFFGWTANGWRYQEKISTLKSEHSKAIAESNASALDRYAKLEKQKQDAINESSKLQQKNRDAAISLSSDLLRLREQLTENGLSTNPAATNSNNTTTLKTLLVECSSRYAALAEVADGHALDSMTFQKAWPK